MEGASQLLVDFDEDRLDDGRTVFAGGGRGLMLVHRKKADKLADSPRREFSEKTKDGVLATAIAPFSEGATAASLGMLRLKMGVAKDAAPGPEQPVGSSSGEVCTGIRRSRELAILLLGAGLHAIRFGRSKHGVSTRTG